jgi:hypothetical protein
MPATQTSNYLRFAIVTGVRLYTIAIDITEHRPCRLRCLSHILTLARTIVTATDLYTVITEAIIHTAFAT